MPITNPELATYAFLNVLQENGDYPDSMIQKGIRILQNLCVKIEAEKPATKKEVARLLYAATQQFNDLQAERNVDPIPQDTLTRHIIDANYNVILDAYGYDFKVEDVLPS